MPPLNEKQFYQVTRLTVVFSEICATKSYCAKFFRIKIYIFEILTKIDLKKRDSEVHEQIIRELFGFLIVRLLFCEAVV